MSINNKRIQPKWSLPSNQNSKQLFLYNSLTRTKTEFKPSNGRRINWYNCGPTVYDVSHMGHARSYITFDIIRRVLQSYFNYDVFFVQNVTDIDDKIIRRARQKFLFERYFTQMKSYENRNQVINDINEALLQLKIRFSNEVDVDKKNMFSKMIVKAEEVVNSDSDLESIINNTSDVLSDWLDRQKGHEIRDNDIFISLPRHFEEEYNEDMKSLNILFPDSVTRVSEFIPEIIDYIKVIINNGYAYESNGSVYFDTDKFDSKEEHYYAKLVPEAFGDNKALAEGEGDLSVTGEKRSANDFALWKNSKPGEPFWSSPWGDGRPGWHIECSVMASSLIGEQMDIHSGGFDLKFPHHDNELAQAEAYYNTGKPWINYFLHSGHLTISGCKMSKSLKNFITIKDALKKNTWRQLRFAFLLHSWKDTLDYSDNTMSDAVQYEKFANEFFLTVKDLVRHSSQNQEKQIVKWSTHEIDLNNKFHESIERIDSALCDNIDTRTACEEIRRLIASCNCYLQENSQSPNITLFKNIALYITKLFDIFGAGSSDETIGFSVHNSEEGHNRETTLMPFLEVISNLREKVRIKAKELKNNELLSICDELRDDILPNLGVRLEDYDVGEGMTRTRLKLVDRETLLKEREEKLRAEETKRLEKEKKRLEKEKADLLKEAQKKIPPSEMFITEVDKYSRFDEKGMPTHDLDGKELSKGLIKKLSKLYQTQENKYNDYLKSEANTEISNQTNGNL